MKKQRARKFDERSTTMQPDKSVLELNGLPGGAKAFLHVAKFCYGVKMELTASNVVGLGCATEYLQMKLHIALRCINSLVLKVADQSLVNLPVSSGPSVAQSPEDEEVWNGISLNQRHQVKIGGLMMYLLLVCHCIKGSYEVLVRRRKRHPRSRSQRRRRGWRWTTETTMVNLGIPCRDRVIGYRFEEGFLRRETANGRDL
ncbi:hypothetical protein V8G54_012290 [Vigna mungo]|uniref:Uncharacterized protein n=1 Tax=Vigna mungo TaxID=3915 RepID=A0AAQ3S0F9_VIGMU